MSYNPSNLSALSYANGFTLWHYRTVDPYDEVTGYGYFNNATSILRDGDSIILNHDFATDQQGNCMLEVRNLQGFVEVKRDLDAE